MKLSFASIVAATLWAAAVHAQVFQGPHGPAGAAPASPDDKTPLHRPAHRLPSTTGMASGTPGPFLPNPNDPTRSSPTVPDAGVAPPPPAGQQWSSHDGHDFL